MRTLDSPGARVCDLATEALIIARYMMFTQVYFQHTRRAYDHHSVQAISALLQEDQRHTPMTKRGMFPPPTFKENVEEYLKWDDWRVLGMISEGGGGQHGRILVERKHFRRIFETPEIPTPEDQELAQCVQETLGERVGFMDCATSSWYKMESADVPLLLRPGQTDEQLTTLSKRSAVVRGLQDVKRTRIYVPIDKRPEARRIVDDTRKDNQK